jgi:ribosomal protein L30
MATKTKVKNSSPGTFSLGGRVVVKQIRSCNGRPKDQRATLLTMGLGRIGHMTTQELNPSLYGKMRKVWHMIEVKSAD